jgi:hypothetical protein
MELDCNTETWYVYPLPPRDGVAELTLPVTTYIACKRSERGEAGYERAWRCYLLAMQIVRRHPLYCGDRRGEPRVLYDLVADDTCWLFRTEPEGATFVVTSRQRSDLDAVRRDRDVCEMPFGVQVEAPSRAA